jgi:hypothetical protein
MKAQEEPMAVDHEHPFGPLALLRDADLLATRLAGANDPSRKDIDQSS